MQALLRLAQVEAGAAGHDLAAVVDVQLDLLLQVEQARLALHQRQGVDAHRDLHLRVREQLVDHYVAICVAPQLDDDAHAAAVRLVAQVGDPFDAAVAVHVGDSHDQVRLVHLIRDLRDHDRLAAGLQRLEHQTAAYGDAPPSRPVRLGYGVPAVDDAAGGKIGSGDESHQLVDRDPGVVDVAGDRARHLAQVVRRNVGRHADGDAAGAVGHQERKGAGKDRRLLELVVVVGLKVDGVPVDVGQHLVRDRRQPRLRVALGRRRVAVDGAEVALAVDHGVAQREVLRHADQGVVDRLLAVRMELTQHLADDAGGLAVGPVGPQPHLVHGVQDAAVYRLEAVAGIGQRAADDDRHGVGQVGRSDLVLHLPRYDAAVRIFGRVLVGHVPSPDRWSMPVRRRLTGPRRCPPSKSGRSSARQTSSVPTESA